MKEVFWGRFVFCSRERKRKTRLDKKKRESDEDRRSFGCVGIFLDYFGVVLVVLEFFLIVLEEFFLFWRWW